MAVLRASEWYDPVRDVWSTAEPLPESVSFASYTSVQVGGQPTCPTTAMPNITHPRQFTRIHAEVLIMCTH